MLEKQIRDFIMKRDAYARHLGIELEEVHEGYARVVMPLEAHHCNGMGMAHGGAIFSLADLAFAVAANSCGAVSLSLTASISFLSPGKVSPLRAEAREISSTKRIATYEVRIEDGDGTLLAVCQATAYRKNQLIPVEGECSCGANADRAEG